MNRRAYLTIAAGTVAGLAGCLGGDSESDDEGEPNATDAETEPEGAESAAGEWPYPGHDLGDSSYTPDESGFEAEPATAWRHGNNDYGYSEVTSLIVEDGTVYAARDGVRAFDSNGEERWAESYTAESHLALLDGDLLFVNDNGRIVRLDAETGDRTDVVAADIPNPASAVITADGIYAIRSQLGSRDSILGKYDLESGDAFWKYPEEDTFDREVSLPVFSGDAAIVRDGRELVSLDPETGDANWRSDSREWATASDNGSSFRSHIARDGAVYVDCREYVWSESENQDGISVLDAATGEFRRYYETDGRLAAVDDELAYVTDDDLLTGLDVESGAVELEYVASATIVDVTVTSDTVYLYERPISGPKVFAAVSKADGSERFSATYSLRNANDVDDHVVAAADTVYLAADELHALRPADEVGDDEET